MESYIQQFSIWAIPILMALTFHEMAHGMIAYKFGDPTAKNAGRLTLNPLSHLDFMGTLVFLITIRMGIGIGWAKPVPVNPIYFKNPRKGMLWVALAGPATNLFLALLNAVALIWLYNLHLSADSFWWSIKSPFFKMAEAGVKVNVGLAIFNFIPIPPLDGGRIMVGLLPERHAISYARLEPYGFLILLLLLVSDAISYLIYPLIRIVEALILFSANVLVG